MAWKYWFLLEDAESNGVGKVSGKVTIYNHGVAEKKRKNFSGLSYSFIKNSTDIVVKHSNEKWKGFSHAIKQEFHRD